MKNTVMKTLFYVFAFAILLSCNSNKNNEILNYTTDTTLGLSRINLNSISEKIPVDKILKEKKNLKDDEKFFLQLVNKPKESGINAEKPLYFIVDQGKTMSEPDVKAFLWIKDKEKFQKSMSDLTKSKITIDKKDYIYVGGKLTGSIKGNLVIITSEKSYNPYAGVSYMNSSGVESSSKLNEKYFTDFWERKGTSNSAIKEQVNQSLASDKDVSGWVNLASLASYVSKGYIETLAVNKLIKDSGIGFDFNFGKGESEMDTKTFFNNDMKKVVEQYYDKNKLNYNLVKNVELDNAKSFTIGFFSLDFMRYLIKEAGFEATVNHYLVSTNKTLEDITSTFTGDYAFVDFKSKPTDTVDYYYKSKNALILGFNPKKKDNLTTLLQGPLGASRKYMIGEDEVIFSDDNNAIYQFQNKKAGKNAKLDKKSGVTAYSWSDGGEYNKKSDATVKVVDMVNESKEEDGNIVSKTVFTFDKKDENVLYYLIING